MQNVFQTDKSRNLEQHKDIFESMEISPYFQIMIKGISELVKIPTLYDETAISPSEPYGKKVSEGLEWIKKTALKDGFEILEFDGHVLAIRIKGTSSGKRIDVVSHVDVVEPGEGWNHNPFKGDIQNGYIYGRGTQDMKGPLMVTYYALKYIKDHNLQGKNEIRIVIGSDEERTMGDMRYYITKAGEPDFAFTPDGKFPLSYGEKGALMWHIQASMDTCIVKLAGGVQCNVVSPSAVAFLDGSEKVENYRKELLNSGYRGEISIEGELLKITVHGRAAHAGRPSDGCNATVQLLDLIQRVSQDSLAVMLYHCFSDPYGTGAGIYYDMESMGKLTLNLGILIIENHTVTADIDCRYPYGTDSFYLTQKLKEALEPFSVELKYDDKPTITDISSPYVQTLLTTYRRITGDTNAEPMVSSGVTYSKAIRNCVAFGPMKEDELLLAHQADEKIEINKIKQLFMVYTEAMYRLSNLQES
ncbi:Sapep family Mn(2+)-dependent dipeptidase [Anaerocolumna sedimenticola]|uniref:Sapep family Mn(2+)-dependent dipeptidase n=1 Tax=Anaerocolumna sedimenticola TaxID=2696063 RepID=A0A6P1TI55_9FIRM|nr:Sapep family Mn(2+)-dependent dipeptidase [Anaerocolumna sedimenticola]QHQ59606.1 Sapep family Mn(2+)-dependent dipeptidase [Anaerocolumna sedimenticola]